MIVITTVLLQPVSFLTLPPDATKQQVGLIPILHVVILRSVLLSLTNKLNERDSIVGLEVLLVSNV